MRKKATFPPKSCERCGAVYSPTGPSSKFCGDCCLIVDRERKQKWYIENKPNAYSPAKKYTATCVVCGQPFNSSYKGFDCCQKHYNIAYRTGSPFTPEGRKTTNTFREVDGYIVGKTNSGVEYFFDKEHLAKVSKYSWCLSKTGYLVANINSKVIKLHRYIMEPLASEIIDHINRNPLDNRNINLRCTTQKNNSRNCSVSKSNKLKKLGISTTKSGKYRVRIMVDGKEINLGRYDNLNDATETREKAEKKYFGDYAPMDHQEI